MSHILLQSNSEWLERFLSAGANGSARTHNAVNFGILRQIVADKGNYTTEILRFTEDKNLQKARKMGVYEEQKS